MALMGCWAVLTLVLPTLANAALSRAIPVSQGVELMLAQRQTVHGAWDLPREQTMERFFRSHPEWRDTAALPAGRSEEHTSELQSQSNLVCRLLLEKKKNTHTTTVAISISESRIT